MEINSLKKKGTLTDNENEKYLDLSISALRKDLKIGTKAIYVVTKETEMRVDLISIKYYGSSKYIDVICKANNIFNPFSIAADDILVIPNVGNDNDLYVSNEDISDGDKGVPSGDIRGRFIDEARLSQQDKNRIDRLKEKAAGKKGAVDDILPTNMLQSNVKSKVVKDGMIQLGSNLNNR